MTPLDSRCNNALGLRRLRQGQFAEAEGYFRRAVERLTLRNPNPYDGEPYYNLGLALRWQGRDEEAFDAFYKATWNAAWQDAAYFELAQLGPFAATTRKLSWLNVVWPATGITRRVSVAGCLAPPQWAQRQSRRRDCDRTGVCTAPLRPAL